MSSYLKEVYRVGNKSIEVVNGSITQYEADAIVIPANPDLEMVAVPGGIQFAVLMDGGKEIFEEAIEVAEEYAKKYGYTTIGNIKSRVPPFSAHATSAGRLPAKYVIHSVSVNYHPKFGLYCDREVIRKSVKNALMKGKELGLKSMGFPALGTGLYRVPLHECTEVTIDEFVKHLKGETSLERLGYVLYSTDSYFIAKEICDVKLKNQQES